MKRPYLALLALLGAALVAGTRAFAAGDAPKDLSADAFSRADLDTTVSPAESFYQFADGGWIRNHPTPPEFPSFGTFTELNELNTVRVHRILEDAAANGGAAAGSEARKIGDFYASGMDSAAIEAAGLDPVRPELDRIDAMKSAKDLQAEILHLQMIGVRAPFNFGSMQDFKNSEEVIGGAFQGGLGLRNRDYYTKDDPKSKEIRDNYVKHVAAMFQLLGDDEASAGAHADTVMAIETRLALSSLRPVEMRDPHATYHPMTVKQLIDLTPEFDWTSYLQGMGLGTPDKVNMGTPDFFKTVNAMLQDTALPDWKTYLRWHFIASVSPYLTQKFVDEDFNFASQLMGMEKQQERWKRVVRTENRVLGFAVGKEFVKEYFPPESKSRVEAILRSIRGALSADLDTLSWMGPETRTKAKEKLAKMNQKIGYPDKWRDYSKLQIDRGPYVLNVMRSREFENQRDLDKIGKPVDRTEWGMVPQTVNAYYNPSMNEIVFPAGILQPPFFDPQAPEAWNYGAVGTVMGHEITHGFDDQGSQFDALGNLENWWTKDDRARFDKATECVADQFSGYVVDGDAHVQGKLVTGEAIADLGGVKLAYTAYRMSEAGGGEEPMFKGFTPDQTFFLGFARVWATDSRPQYLRMQVTSDPHPPARFRVDGTVTNVPEFARAFGVKPGEPMAREGRCVIW